MKEISLQFDRSQDVHTDYYYIYRSTTPDVSRRSTRVMKVQHTLVGRPIDVHEVAKRVSSTEFKLGHGYVFKDLPIEVSINGNVLEDPTYVIDYVKGLVTFDTPVIETDTVEVSYAFDGIEVIDDFGTNEFVEVNYYGPPARDNTRPAGPGNVSMVPNLQGGIEVRFQPILIEGVTFYYRIEARNDRGDFSQLSPVFSIHLIEELEEYLIESSRDGLTWSEISSTTSLSYVDQQADNEPPEGLRGVAKNVLGTQVTLSWTVPLINAKAATTPRYRIKARLTNGNVSEPSKFVGPELITSPIEKIVILRKVGLSFPVYGDPTAERVADITDYSAGNFVQVVSVGQSYSYSLFVIDKAGNRSIASTILVTT